MEENSVFEQKREIMIQEINDIVCKEISILNKKICKGLEQVEKVNKLKNIKEEKNFLALYNDIKLEMQNIGNIENVIEKESEKNSTENFSKEVEEMQKDENIVSSKIGDNNKLIISEKERKGILTLQKRRG